MYSRNFGKIIVVIPAYNEDSQIANVVLGSMTYLPVLVIDDGSTDETVQITRSTGAEILLQAPNQGKGTALQAGFQHALDEGFEAVITLDADGQHDPNEIPKFLNAYNAKRTDLIIGVRDFSQMPLVRRLANTLGTISFSWALGQNIPDNQSGYRLISRRLMNAVLKSEESGFEFEVEMIRICVQWGFTMDWVPISTIYAGEKSHIHPLKHLMEFLRIVLQTRRDG
ncbi:glycosyltransferase family 2 protein [Chloroflexota bacterium]